MRTASGDPDAGPHTYFCMETARSGCVILKLPQKPGPAARRGPGCGRERDLESTKTGTDKAYGTRAQGILLRYNPFQKKRLLEFLFVLFLTLTADFVFTDGRPFLGLSSYLYISLVIAWALSVNRRISDTAVRRLLIAASVFMALLFELRLCRYYFFTHSPAADELIRYCYFIPQIYISLFFYLTACCIGKTGEEHPLKNRIWLIAAAALLCAADLLNHRHGLLFDIRDLSTEDLVPGPLYALTAGWIAFFGFSGFFLLLKSCRISAVRRHWYIPSFFIAFFTLLLGIYYAIGGSPELFGHKLYNFQEIFCLLFVSAFESAIQIGLIPSNTAYDMLFRQSHIRAALLDDSGMPVLTSADYLLGRLEENREEDVSLRQNSRRISGGSIIWKEDLAAIQHLNQEIEDATQELEGENDLIRQENAIREEQFQYERQNRVFDSIAEEVRAQTAAIDRLLSEENVGEEEFRERLLYSMVLGAYVKRMGNLMLLSQGRREIPAAELGLSLAESLDQIRLAGKNCDLLQNGEGMLAPELALSAYRLFEDAVQERWENFRTCLVSMRTGKDFCLTVALDCQVPPALSAWKNRPGQQPGELRVYREDETVYISLSAGKEDA